LAGTVEAVGSNVTEFEPGDEVYGTCDGSFAECACARVGLLALKAANLSFEQAAAVPVSAVTASQGVRDRAKVRAGENVLIIGASGGVGTFAIQIAKALGAEVTGVCSPAKMDLVRALGADQVVDYTGDDFADGEHTTTRSSTLRATAGCHTSAEPSLRKADSSSSEARPTDSGSVALTASSGQSCFLRW